MEQRNLLLAYTYFIRSNQYATVGFEASIQSEPLIKLCTILQNGENEELVLNSFEFNRLMLRLPKINHYVFQEITDILSPPAPSSAAELTAMTKEMTAAAAGEMKRKKTFRISHKLNVVIIFRKNSFEMDFAIKKNGQIFSLNHETYYTVFNNGLADFLKRVMDYLCINSMVVRDYIKMFIHQKQAGRKANEISSPQQLQPPPNNENINFSRLYNELCFLTTTTTCINVNDVK